MSRFFAGLTYLTLGLILGGAAIYLSFRWKFDAMVNKASYCHTVADLKKQLGEPTKVYHAHAPSSHSRLTRALDGTLFYKPFDEQNTMSYAFRVWKLPLTYIVANVDVETGSVIEVRLEDG